MRRSIKQGLARRASVLCAVALCLGLLGSVAQAQNPFTYGYNSADITTNPVTPTISNLLFYSQNFNATPAWGTGSTGVSDLTTTRTEWNHGGQTIGNWVGAPFVGTAAGQPGGGTVYNSVTAPLGPGWQTGGGGYLQGTLPTTASSTVHLGNVTTPASAVVPGVQFTINVPETGLGLASLSGRLVIGGQWGALNRTWTSPAGPYSDVAGSAGNDQLVFQITQNGVTKTIFAGTFDNQSLAGNSSSLAATGYDNNTLFKLVQFANGADANGFVNDAQAAQVGSSRANLASFYTFNLPVAVQPGQATISIFGAGNFAGVTSLGAPAQQLNLEFFGLDDLQFQFLMTPEPGSVALFGLAAVGVGVLGWRRRRKKVS